MAASSAAWRSAVRLLGVPFFRPPVFRRRGRFGGSTHSSERSVNSADQSHGPRMRQLVAHVQDQVPKIAAKLNGIGRAAIAVRGGT